MAKREAISEAHGWVTECSAAQVRMHFYARIFTAGAVVGGVVGFALKDNIVVWVQTLLAQIKN